ncbi:helix-turn-helix domain-containing protein [Cellulomonas xylanilytica]|uniref:Helix-turn-helix domain-containing protein n=1 Tax=Cellulomonas xylanilytica TaxID=233583 RepID=A0A510UZA4_9CELL|nr:helix-turn-helix domain-containing protein [Cellulomonas xylanilytica]GEK19919.1 hypothetical protein CXY01_04390 [Cellulomonas xylanilytica]
MTPRILLSVNEAAAALGIGRTLMYELLGSGQVESVFVGRLHRVPADALMAFVDKLRSESQGDASTSGGTTDPFHRNDDGLR